MNRQLLFLALLVATLTILPSPRAQAHADDRRISVSGQCRRQVTPDRGSIVITADFKDADLKVASRRATEAYDRLKDAIKRLNLDQVELQTSEYNLAAVYEWVKDRNVPRGFRARMGLSVSTAAIQRLGEVIAMAAREGIQDVGALRTYLSDDKRTQEQNACLKEAAENARAKADRLAAALGAKVSQVISVSESGEAPPPFQPMMMMEAKSMATADAPPPGVEAGKQSFNLQVAVVFGLQ